MTRMRRLLAAVATTAGAAVALSGCSVYDLPLPGGADTGSNPITVTAKFRDVLDLVPQSTVKVHDISVGKISDIKLDGDVAVVTMQLPHDVDVPDNARAEIRQTSLLGEKFVSLEEPTQPSAGKLHDGSVIPLAATSRNPEIEEVLGALSALLNGGGVAQLQTISSELNTAVGGRESEIRSVLDQLHSFMGQLDANKQSVVSAIENLNRLAVQLRQQDGSIKSALDNLPAALSSIDRQRTDLRKMLQALGQLSDVGVKVITQAKASTINSLRDLAPVLDKLAAAGQNFQRSLQVALTYPFVDEAVGRDPQVARNLNMGDYTNLSITLDLDLLHPPTIPGLPGVPSLPDIIDICKKTPLAAVCSALPVDQLCSLLPTNPLCTKASNPTGGINSGTGGLLGGLLGGGKPKNSSGTTRSGTTSGSGSGSGTTSGGGGGLLDGLLGGLGRAELGSRYRVVTESDPLALRAYGLDDTGLGTLLLQGVATK